MTTSQKFHETLKDDILVLLADKPLTSRDLEAKLGASYPSTRRAMVELENEGRIVKFDRRARNARYTLGTQAGPKSIVPKVSFKGNTVSLTDLTLNSGLTEATNEHADAIMRAWTTIAITAERLNSGVPDQVLVKRLNRQKVDLAKARNYLEHVTFLINQILDNPKLWDIDSLSQFPDDKNWTDFRPALQAMYNHYYGGEGPVDNHA